MSRDYGRVKAEDFGKLTATVLFLSEDGEDAHPRRMGKGLTYRYQAHLRRYCIIAHRCKYTAQRASYHSQG